MCTTCGCSDGALPVLTDPDTGETVTLAAGGARHHHHHHDHGHDHDHHHHDPGHNHAHHQDHSHHPAHGTLHHGERAHGQGATITLEADLLAKNDRLAERNRGWFDGRNILALNLVSSPGAGKTTLLERTLKDLGGELPISVLEGDQATTNDARRIRATGARAVQINTGTGCHLEADMLARGLKMLDPPANSIVMIENVGNLVCPALFDLGERSKVAILSVTEGEDKPVKYPHMFQAADIMILNKIDLLPHVEFDVRRCLENARQVNPGIRVFRLSATSGEGLEDWYAWLRRELGATGPLPA